MLWAEVRLTSGLVGECTTALEFWIDEDVAPMEGSTGGMLAHIDIDLDFLLTHGIGFSVSGAKHFGVVTITFSYEDGIIGEIDILGSPLSGVDGAFGFYNGG